MNSGQKASEGRTPSPSAQGETGFLTEDKDKLMQWLLHRPQNVLAILPRSSGRVCTAKGLSMASFRLPL